MKRTICFLLTLMMVLGLFPVLAYAQETEPIPIVQTDIPAESVPVLYGNQLVDGLDDSFENPTPISNGETLRGTVDTTSEFTSSGLATDQNDYFCFTLDYPTTVTIEVNSNKTLYGVILYDKDGMIIATGTLIRKELTKGYYSVCIQNKPKTGRNPYSISLNYCDHPNAASETHPASCTTDGYIRYSCGDCGASWVEVIPAGHSYSNWETKTDSTCTEAGEKVRTCASCGDKQTEAIPAKGHSYGDWVVTKQPTETTEGLKVKTCATCGDTLEEVLPKQEHVHNHTAVVTSPTCIDQGYTTHTCTCGDSYVDSYVPANGVHSYTDDTDASCNVCGYVREIGGGSDPGTDTGDLGSKENPVIVTLGETYHKEWVAHSEIEHYSRFTIPEQGIVTFHVTKPVVGNHYERYEFVLFDMSGNAIYADNCYETQEDDNTYYEFHCGLEAGTYSLEIVSQYYDRTYSMDYRLTFAPTQYCEVEPNDKQETATALKVNQQYTGHYGGGNYDAKGADWYQFELKKDCTYRISVDGLQAVNPIVYLMGDSMEDQHISHEENYVFEVPEDGTYYLKIYNVYSRQHTYQISVETLDHFAQEAAFDTDYRKEWHNNLYDHYVKFTVPERGIATFHVTKPVVEDKFHSYTFTIWDASENTIFSMGTEDSVTDKNTYYEFHCGLEAGNYYMMIVPDYTLLSQTFSSDYRISFTPNAYCEVEPNGDQETATELTLGIPYTGHYGSDGGYSHANSDYYKFDAIAGHAYKITIENFTQFQDTYTWFYLLGDTQTSLKHTMEKQVDENGLHYYTFTADKTGTYYIKLENNHGVQIPYKIMVAEEAGGKENPVLVTLGETYHKEWPYRGGDHYARFTIPERGIVTFHATKPVVENQYEEYEFTLLDLSGNTIYANDCYKAVDDERTFYEFHCGLEAGTYLWMISYDGNSGSSDYKITFSPTQYCETEPNDEKETATVLTLGKQYTGHYGGGSHDLYKADYYQFQAKKGHTYKIALDGLKDMDCLVTLINGDTEKSIFTRKTYTLTAAEEQTYYIKIWNVFNHQHTYQMMVSADHVHSHTAVVTKPTCTEEGYTTHTCSCGDSYVDTKVPALKHDYVNGICTRCGAEDTSTPAEGATVTRIAGYGRCQTAMEAAEELKKIQGVEKFRTILVADGNNYPDALSGSYLAAVADAPILLVQANQKKVTQTVKEYILDNLTADATVYILGGTNSIPTDFETSIRTAGYTVKRLAGNDRYMTSLMIIQEGDALLAQQGKAPADSLLVCVGGGYADSLSASATGRPVLLVNGGKTALTTSQKNYLDSIGKRNIYIIGGPNSVSNAIATQLNAYDTDGITKRIAGDGREETSAKVAHEFFPNATFAVLADGNNYPDGLSGGPVAYAKDAPLLLIRAKRESHAKDYVGDRIKNGYILGGPNSVSDNSAKVIFGENAIIK